MVEWRPASGFEEIYEVSNIGGIRRIAADPLGRVHNVGRVRYGSVIGSGYLGVQLRRDGEQFCRAVHRLVALAFLGPNPPKLQVNHKNGNKHDNRVENLEYVSASENLRHSFRELGRNHIRGQRHKNARLLDADIPIIRNAVLTRTHGDVAVEYGVSRQAISAVVEGITWKHI